MASQLSEARIALYGNSGSGKSRIRDYLKDRHGFTVASSGNICRLVSQLVFDSEDRDSLNKISTALRQIDEQVWINAALRKVISDRVVFDSVRYMTDVHYLSILGFQFWHIFCPSKEAIKRLNERGQKFSPSDLEHESEIALRDYNFDITIDNGDRSWTNVCKDIDENLSNFNV